MKSEKQEKIHYCNNPLQTLETSFARKEKKEKENLNRIRFSSFNITKHHLMLSILQTRQSSIYISSKYRNDIGEHK